MGEIAKTFISTVPCVHGHTGARYVKGGCVVCVKQRARAREKVHKDLGIKRVRNPEKTRENARKGYARNKAGHREKMKRYSDRIWSGQKVSRDRAKILKEAAVRWQEHKAKRDEEKTTRLATKTERAKRTASAAYHRRRARQLEAGGNHTSSDIKKLGDAQRWRCANPLCREKIKISYHIDHIVPLIRGGSNSPRNLQLLCAPCNRSKGPKDPIRWAQENGMLL